MITRQILGLGTIVIDHQLFVDRFPTVDTKVEATGSRYQIGGPVPTALVFLSRLGHDCSYVGVWGDDQFGQTIESDLRAEKIRFSPDCRQAIETGLAQVWVDEASGSRTIVCRRVSPDEASLSRPLESLPEKGILTLDGWPPNLAVQAAQAARQQGLTVFLDTGSPKGRTDELLRHVDLVNAPRRFLRQFFDSDHIESGAQQLLAFGPKMVTVTDGERGAWLFTRDNTYHQTAFPIEAVDTTGAGDIFSGALVHASLQDWSEQRMLKFASAAAALKCRQPGNRDALPTHEQIEDFLAITD
ncbi:MAG: hypothetical protein HUJ26_08235 [Planctomycetaceae bacterium]|nr:hypothetical protein [Planctomycetaceae bacterium]